jgi:hypothetical protein
MGDHGQAPVQGETGAIFKADQWVNNYQAGNGRAAANLFYYYFLL